MKLYWLILIIGLIILFWKKNNTFKYFAKFSIYMGSMIFFSSIFIPIMLLRPRDPENFRFILWFLRQTSKLIGLNWVVRGENNAVKDEGAVLISNHQSYIDFALFAEIVSVVDSFSVISKKEVFYMWPFGLASWLWGTIFIDRSQRKKAQIQLNKIASSIKTNKKKIYIFPEGTRHGGEKLLPFKKGAFHLAIDAQAPIQPIVVSQYKFLDSKNYRFDDGSPVISFLPPIPTVGLTKENLDELIEKTYEAMSEEYQALNSESM